MPNNNAEQRLIFFPNVRRSLDALMKRKTLTKSFLKALGRELITTPIVVAVVILTLHYVFKLPWRQALLVTAFTRTCGMISSITRNTTEHYRETENLPPISTYQTATIAITPYLAILGFGLLYYFMYRIPMTLYTLELGTVAVMGFWTLDWLLALSPFKKGTKRYRKRNGLCLQCGYDLRETPERCPECGEMKSRNESNLQVSV